MPRKKIIITSGEPAGIGPDLCLQLLELLPNSGEHHSLNNTFKGIDFLVIGDPELFHDRAKQLDKDIVIHCVQHDEIEKDFPPDKLCVLPINCKTEVSVGELNVSNANYVMAMLDTAIDLCRNNICQAMVTCPIQKSILIEAGFKLQGHTEYLAQKCNVDQVVMMLANPHLKVALATTHIPLHAVSQAINEQALIQTIRIVYQDLIHKFNIAQPVIYVCGLNPHAGENGHLGMEEITTIMPALKKLEQEGINTLGPLPADTIFNQDNREHADAFIAMYHDQGLPVLKALGFGDSINITLGLPIIRTSVDHGTALDLAGTGKINLNSFQEALRQAAELINQ